MDRRTFATAAIASSCLAATGVAADPKLVTRELYELRTYIIKSSKQSLLDAYLKEAFIPALRRMDFGPVGVFNETDRFDREVLTDTKTDTSAAKDMQRVLVLIVHRKPESFVSLPATLSGDRVYLKAADEFLAARADDPAYVRIWSSLLYAFDGMPKLEKPDTSKPRLFQLRVYESHNERAAAKKVEMFESEEIAIFRRCGMTPVFFGSGLTGMPCVTYLLVFPDEEGKNAAWSKFGMDSQWQTLKSNPAYAEANVSKIVNVVMTPRPYSEI